LSLSNHDHILFNAEILRASSIAPNHSFVDTERIEHGSPLRLPGHPMNGQPMDLEGWSGMQTEVLHI
jgi:protein quaking